MATQVLINGQLVPLTPEEAATVEADWQIPPNIYISPAQEIDALVLRLQDITTYDPGAIAGISVCIDKGAWAFALIFLGKITPTANDQTTYDQIQAIIQAQV
jgi:hypothetical protein